MNPAANPAALFLGMFSFNAFVFKMNKHIVGSVDLYIGIFKSKEIIHLSSIWMENKRVLSVLFQNILFS